MQLGDAGIWGEMFPTGEAHGYLDEGVFTLDELRVRRDEGAGITLRGEVGREWALDMELVADGIELAGNGRQMVTRAEGPLGKAGDARLRRGHCKRNSVSREIRKKVSSSGVPRISTAWSTLTMSSSFPFHWPTHSTTRLVGVWAFVYICEGDSRSSF